MDFPSPGAIVEVVGVVGAALVGGKRAFKELKDFMSTLSAQVDSLGVRLDQHSRDSQKTGDAVKELTKDMAALGGRVSTLTEMVVTTQSTQTQAINAVHERMDRAGIPSRKPTPDDMVPVTHSNEGER